MGVCMGTTIELSREEKKRREREKQKDKYNDQEISNQNGSMWNCELSEKSLFFEVTMTFSQLLVCVQDWLVLREGGAGGPGPNMVSRFPASLCIQPCPRKQLTGAF